MDTNKAYLRCLQEMKSYRPSAKGYRIGHFAMRQYWNALEPSVYMGLFTYLATIKEGTKALTEFAAKADPRFAQPEYLAWVVLTPVNKIVAHLMDILLISGILKTEDAKKMFQMYNKARLMCYYYVTKRYIEALTQYSKDRPQERDDSARTLTPTEITSMGGITAVLLNLPREYQRWNRHYERKDKSIWNDLHRGRPQGKPFDVEQSIHSSFEEALKQDGMDEDTELTIELQKSWDPCHLALGTVSEEWNITVKDFCKDPPEYLTAGQPRDKRDKTNQKSKRNNEKDDEDDDNNNEERQEADDEAEEQMDTESTNAEPNKKKQKTAHNTNRKNELPNQQNNTEASENALHAMAIKKIICDHVRAIRSRQKTTEEFMDAWNGIAKAIIQKITKEDPPEEQIITGKDIV